MIKNIEGEKKKFNPDSSGDVKDDILELSIKWAGVFIYILYTHFYITIICMLQHLMDHTILGFV